MIAKDAVDEIFVRLLDRLPYDWIRVIERELVVKGQIE